MFNSFVEGRHKLGDYGASPLGARNAPGPIWLAVQTAREATFIVQLDPGNDFEPVRFARCPKSALDGIGGDREVIWAAAVKPNPGEVLPNWIGRLSPEDWSQSPEQMDRTADIIAERNYVGTQYPPPQIVSVGGDHLNMYAVSALWSEVRQARLPFLHRVWPTDFDLGPPRSPPQGFTTSGGSSLIGSIGGSVDVCWLGGKSGLEDDPNIAELDPWWLNMTRSARINEIGAFMGIGGSRHVIWALDEHRVIYEIDPVSFNIVRSKELPGIEIAVGPGETEFAYPIGLGGA